jgi:hypothetical protein
MRLVDFLRTYIKKWRLSARSPAQKLLQMAAQMGTLSRKYVDESATTSTFANERLKKRGLGRELGRKGRQPIDRRCVP